MGRAARCSTAVGAWLSRGKWLAPVAALLLLGLACGPDGSSEPANSSESGPSGSVRIVETTAGTYSRVGPAQLQSTG